MDGLVFVVLFNDRGALQLDFGAIQVYSDWERSAGNGIWGSQKEWGEYLWVMRLFSLSLGSQTLEKMGSKPDLSPFARLENVSVNKDRPFW